MLYSKLFGKTTKSVTKEAVAASHRLLLQGGFIRQLSAGRYSILPLGLKVTKKIEAIIRSEVEETGAQELVVPTLHPIELWQQANRDRKFGPAMMRVTDRNGSEFTLGATAEVVMLDLVKQFKPSYKDLPINIYQFSQKFRDEARPTGGLLRVREFIMKDAYSFDINEEEHKKIYQAYWKAYEKIAKTLDLKITIVESDNGAIGGSISHEFMVETEVGEDTIAKCQCGYSANIETAEFIREPVNLEEEIKPMEIVSQPEWVETMEDNIKHYGKPKQYYLKNVVYKDTDGKIIIAVIRGDLTVNKAKLAKVYGAKGELESASDEDLAAIGTRPGWVHCWGHSAIYVGDLSLKTVRNFIGGQKEKNTDSINVNYGRDFKCDIEGDIAEVEDGFVCPQCKKWQLRLTKAVEFGNIFNIGFVYSDPMEGVFVDDNNQPQKIYMGSYGIGIGRAMATIVETHHDNKGIVWPSSVAPFDVHLIGLDLFDPQVLQCCQELYKNLQKEKIDVLFDDRESVTAGEKFADADLIGVPFRLVVSKRTVSEEIIEIKKRNTGETQKIKQSQLFDLLKS